jgi:hypothetical protein
MKIYQVLGRRVREWECVKGKGLSRAWYHGITEDGKILAVDTKTSPDVYKSKTDAEKALKKQLQAELSHFQEESARVSALIAELEGK